MVLEISVAVIAVCMVLLTIGIGINLLATRKLISRLNRLVEQAQLQTAPLVHDTTLIIGNIRNIVNAIEKDMPRISDSIRDLRGTAADLREFERLLLERVERPLLDLTAIIAGIARGIVVFWRLMGDRR